MKLSRNPLKTLYATWLALCISVFFLLLYPIIYYALSNPRRYPLGHKLRRVWGLLLFGATGIRVKQETELELDPSKPYIITPNHTSQLDIVTLSVKLRLDFSFMAKIELARIPLFGIWFRTIDIGVDRRNVRKAAEAYKKAQRFIDSGRSLIMFPEGTISNKVPTLVPFKDGPFRLAIETQVDILPVTIIGNWILLPDQGVFEGRPGTAFQYIHAPISTKGLTLADTDMLKKKVFDIIQSKLREYGYSA